MLELLTTYSITEIIIFIVMLLLALEEGIKKITWLKNYFKEKFSEEDEEEQVHQSLEDKIEQQQIKINEMKQSQIQICECLNLIGQKVDLLIDSDKNDIKTWITEKHHYFCYEKGWIDDYSLEGIERRYTNYKQEHGNSYIGDLMKDLRQLPKKPIE